MADTDTIDPVEDTEQVDETETGEGAESTDTDEWTPPTKDEVEALQKSVADATAGLEAAKAAHAAALKRVNAESANRKRRIAELEQQNEDDTARAQREAKEAALAELKPIAIRATAQAALMAAGADEAKAKRLLRLLDYQKLDIDGETVTGLDDQVEDLKTEWPELFAKPEPEPLVDEPKKPKPAVVQVGDRKPQPRALSPLEQLAQQLDARAK